MGTFQHHHDREGDQHGDNRRGLPSGKPEKLNIPECDGSDVDSWILTVELYFESARTPLDRRTEVFVTYLKGDAIQWWRGTGYTTCHVPWHRFCRCLGDRFSITSICGNVRNFHEIKQTSTVDGAALNLMRRDNPAVPEDYYVHNYISGLQDYIQAHLQCHEPTTMQKAIFLARRIEAATPPCKTFFQQNNLAKRQVLFDSKPTNATPASVL